MTTIFDATYDPDDDKLRLRASSRLDAETYAKVKAIGFGWAPKQGLFLAVWSPTREDLLTDLAGEVGDEETSLEDRAAQRAERFEGYQGKRAAEADQARDAVSSIADGIPLGQPIIIGHHSERHARKDVERIESGMRKAVRLWETAAYWQQRASAAIRAAKYKELPSVRARRIKKLEADKRAHERDLAASERYAAKWGGLENPDSVKRKDGAPTTLVERVGFLARSYYGCKWDLADRLERGEITPEEARASVAAGHEQVAEQERRWVAHLDNRLAYERAMLAADGGTVADKSRPEKGGGCKCWVGRGSWLFIQKVNKVSVTVLDNWGHGGDNFKRTVAFDKLAAVMTKAEVDAARVDGRLVETSDKCGFMIAGAPFRKAVEEVMEEDDEAITKLAAFDSMRSTLEAGVRAVSAPQLYPTPPELAARMVELAGVGPKDRVLEPSTGTGSLLRAIAGAEPVAEVCAVGVNQALCAALAGLAGEVHCRDFLTCTPEQLGRFQVVVMNPPFGDGADVQHVKHALQFLEPGGVLVALCANGPRQQAALRPLASTWENLPDGTFAGEGTNVRAALMTARKGSR
jgi:predicted RNA methylase